MRVGRIAWWFHCGCRAPGTPCDSYWISGSWSGNEWRALSLLPLIVRPSRRSCGNGEMVLVPVEQRNFRSFDSNDFSFQFNAPCLVGLDRLIC
jgi:hypothetical protein